MAIIDVATRAVLLGEAKPFLKWAGGKQQLLAQYDEFFPSSIERYVEPFLGGGAVFFHLWSTGKLRGEVLLADHNEELVNAYNVVKTDVDNLIRALQEHKRLHNAAHYKAVREQDRDGKMLAPLERAARTIYLNKTCYNGLFRVNRRGQFNVPMGSYQNPSIVDPDALLAASAALQLADIVPLDFRALPARVEPGSFVYFDPPYEPTSLTSSFTSYTAANFNSADQEALAGVFAALAENRCLCMLSNSDTPRVRKLYRAFRPLHVIHANRAINSKATGRGAIRELVITSYPSWRKKT